MKASELIKLLESEIEKYGDLVVKYYHKAGDTTPYDVCSYDFFGNYTKERNKAVEIFIH